MTLTSGAPGGFDMALDNGWLVADSDMHILEPPDLWQRYMDPTWRYAAPVGLTELAARHARQGEEPTSIARLSDLHPAACDGRLGRLDQDSVFAHAEAAGLGRQVAARGDGHGGPRQHGAVPEPRAVRARPAEHRSSSAPTGSSPTSPPRSPRAYNDWLHDFCAARHPTACTAPRCSRPTTSPARSTSSRRCVGGSRVQGCVPDARPARPPAVARSGVRPASGAECERLDVPVCFHGGGQDLPRARLRVQRASSDRPCCGTRSTSRSASCSWSRGSRPAACSSASPNLRVGLLEGNCCVGAVARVPARRALRVARASSRRPTSA